MVLVSPGFVDTRILNKGEKNGFPEWLSFLLSKPESVADEIVRTLTRHKDEIYPTFNGKLMRRLYGVFPKATVNSSRMMLAKSWKDFLMNRFDTSDRA
jgi:short-subunit dehydrogenase